MMWLKLYGVFDLCVLHIAAPNISNSLPRTLAHSLGPYVCFCVRLYVRLWWTALRSSMMLVRGCVCVSHFAAPIATPRLYSKSLLFHLFNNKTAHFYVMPSDISRSKPKAKIQFRSNYTARSRSRKMINIIPQNLQLIWLCCWFGFDLVLVGRLHKCNRTQGFYFVYMLRLNSLW